MSHFELHRGRARSAARDDRDSSPPRSGPPTRLGAAVGVLAAAAILVLPAAAARADAAFTVKALMFTVRTGDTSAPTSCKVDANLYTPKGASKEHPVPAMLATNGFGGSKEEFTKLASSYASRGYVFLAYSGLGFGASGCKITLDDREHDGTAGSQLVSFLGGSKAANDGTRIDDVVRDAVDHDGVARSDDPRVGMIGGSYGGQIQFAVAGVDPRVDALNPQITWNDLSYSLVGNNTDFASGVTSSTAGVAKLDWPSLFFGLGVENGLANGIANADASHLGVCPNFSDQACPVLAGAAVNGFVSPEGDAFLRNASVTSYMSRIKIPTFLAQGQVDTLFDLQESVATYKALLAQHTPVKMLWRSAGHSGGTIPGESSDDDPEASYESRMELGWFDYYLKGTGTAPKLDFTFFRNWVPYTGDAAPAVGETPSYPAATTAKLALPGSLSLLTVPTTVDTSGAAVTSLPPTPPIPGVEGSLDTPALPSALEIGGVPSVTMTVDAPVQAAAQAIDNAKLVLFARLDDVAPDGSVTKDVVVSAARIGDVTKPVSIELPGEVHRFAAGHRVRLAISTANTLRRGNVLPGPVTISGVKLTLPVLGAAGKSGSGPDGTTPYTPSAEATPVQADGAGRITAAAAKKACVSRRKIVVHLPRAARGDRVRSVRVLVNGKPIKATRRTATVNLAGTAKGTASVRITVRTVKGRTKRAHRSFKTCTRKGGKSS